MFSILLPCLYFHISLVSLFWPLILSSPDLIEHNNNTNSSKEFSVENLATELLENVLDLNLNFTVTENHVKNITSLFYTFGSLHTLDLLANASAKEEKIHKILKHRRDGLLKEAGIISRYILDHKKVLLSSFVEAKPNLGVISDIQTFRKHFISEHRITNRWSNFFNRLGKQRKSNYYTETSKSIEIVLELQSVHNKSQRWPNSEDLFASHHAILDIQEVYGVQPGQVFQGLDHDTNFGGRLKSFQFALLGIMAVKIGHLVKSVEWFEFALNYIKAEFHGKDCTIPSDFVKSLLLTAFQEHNYRYQSYNKTNITTPDQVMHMFARPVSLGQSWSTRLPIRKLTLKKYGEVYGNDTDGLLTVLGLDEMYR